MRKLGSGGMADVYLAEDEELGRRVAIKILNDKYAPDDQFVERFRREAKNAAGLSHPNIVSIYDRGEAEGTYYIAMEYLDGRSLKELVVARGPLPIADAIAATRQVLSALRFAHRKGVVHRDIKPHNVMADADGRLKVTDFGIARAGVSQMTEAGSIIGTAQYLSPEQARGAPVDQRSDLYSIGIVLYEMLTGQVPFTGESPVEIAMKHLSDPPRPPSLLRPDIPPDLDMVVLRALAKNPEDRFQTAEEMDAELERVAAGAGVTAETADAATAVLSARRGARERSDGDRPAAPAADRGAPLVPLRRSSAEAPRHLAVGTRPAPRRRGGRGGLLRVRPDPGLARRLGHGLGAVRRLDAGRPRGPDAEQQGAGSDRAPPTEPDDEDRPGLRAGNRRGRTREQGDEDRHLRLHRTAEGPRAGRDGQVSRRRDCRARRREAEIQGAPGLLEGTRRHGRRPVADRRADREPGLDRAHQRLEGAPAAPGAGCARAALRQCRRRAPGSRLRGRTARRRLRAAEGHRDRPGSARRRLALRAAARSRCSSPRGRNRRRSRT